MSVGVRLLKEHSYDELWQRYCGFLDLSVPEFMGIQKNLLLEQLALLQKSPLGRHILGNHPPKTLEEFRRLVPITSYQDYAPFLLDRREDALPAKALLWQRTSGASGEYPFKWAPITHRMYEEMGTAVFSILILATARFKGDISFTENEKMLYALAPPPYATGCWGRRAAEELPVDFLPPLDLAEDMEFEERLIEGLRGGLDSGIDLVFGLPSVLVAIGEQIADRKISARDLLRLARKPRALARTVRARVRSLMAGRPVRPRDLWSLRGVATAGTDASLYSERIEQLWGQKPLDVYGSTEGLILAMQTWDHGDMTFLPYFNFLEFLPEDWSPRSTNGHGPGALLLDELEVGKNYEVVITNFHGGAFVRYRLGDMVTVTSAGNEKLGIRLPQIEFYSRADGIVDLGGFARLTEKTIGEAINGTGIPYEEWTARKEFDESPALHLYIEARGSAVKTERMRAAVHQELKLLHEPYASMETMLRVNPLRVTMLPQGAFKSYIAAQRASGADLAHIKPPHLNPSDEVLASLLNGHTPDPVREPDLTTVS